MKTIISVSAKSESQTRAADKQKWMSLAAQIDKLADKLKSLQAKQRELSPKHTYTKVKL